MPKVFNIIYIMNILQQHISRVLTNTNSLNIIFVRHGQSMGNYAGSIVGWTDSKLTIKGRQQSNKLYSAFYNHVNRFTQIYSSDLVRAVDTAKLSLGFPTRKIIIDQRLREINFGDDQGRHFDSLSDQQKGVINTMVYSAKNGQSWVDVDKRVKNFYSTLKVGNYLVYTHGGLICTQTYDLGLTDVISNCSVLGLRVNQQNYKGEQILFDFAYPAEENI